MSLLKLLIPSRRRKTSSKAPSLVEKTAIEEEVEPSKASPVAVPESVPDSINNQPDPTPVSE